MSRIKSIFSSLKERNRKALIAYIVCGDPNNSSTLEAMEYMAKNGVDIIEIGVPFSDPMAEGPSIQRAHERSLKNNTSLENILALIGDFRKTNTTVGIVLMGYPEWIKNGNYENRKNIDILHKINNIFQNLNIKFNHVRAHTKLNDIDIIRLIAPTTEKERIQKICNSASGFIYFISLKGTTGSEKFNPIDVRENIKHLNEISTLPVVIGFGIKDKETVESIKDLSDGVVVGSALVDLLGTKGFGTDFKEKVNELSSALAD